MQNYSESIKDYDFVDVIRTKVACPNIGQAKLSIRRTVSQFILSLGDSVAATKYPRKFCRERHNLLGYFVAARIYCHCTYRRGGIAISDYTNTIGHQQIALLAIKHLGCFCLFYNGIFFH